MSETILIDLQEALRDRLREDEYFAEIPVFYEKTTDIESEVERALGTLSGQEGLAGVCCVVQQPTASDLYPNIKGGPLIMDVSVLVIESVLINTSTSGTGKAALAVARRALRVLRHFAHEGLCSTLVAAAKAIVPAQVPEGLVGYVVVLTTEERDDQADLKVSTPAASATGGTLTLSCATASAEIRYTWTGEFPSRQAALYAAPVAVPVGGARLRACAYLTGYISSNIVDRTVSDT